MTALLAVEASIVTAGLELTCQTGQWWPDTPDKLVDWLTARVMKEWLHRMRSVQGTLRSGTGILIEWVPSGNLMAGASMKDAAARADAPRQAPFWDSICTAVVEKKGKVS